MQTSEKVTTRFLFKLLVLFVLLFTGVALKSPDLAQPVEAKETRVSPSSSAAEPDSSQLEQWFRMVRTETSAAAL